MKLIISVLLIIITTSLKFKLQLNIDDRKCFYEVLQLNQKYFFQSKTIKNVLYEVHISQLIEGSWHQVVHRTAKIQNQTVSLHKLASSSSVYSFCITNRGEQMLTIKVQIRSGLELFEYTLLPNITDQQIIQKQLKSINKQVDKLLERIDVITVQRAEHQELQNVIQTNIILYTFIAIMFILGVRTGFFFLFKRSLRQRKMI